MHCFENWAVAFVVCNFNVDLGPEIEIVYPPTVPFSTADLSAICFNSFPERQDTETHDDSTFTFTVANNSPDLALGAPGPPHGSATQLFASCVFRQEFDRSLKRCFNQKTLVLVSHHDFAALFVHLVRHMTASAHVSDVSTLEAACEQMAAWPPPAVGRLELPFLGSFVSLEITPHAAFPLQGAPGPKSVAAGARTTTSLYAYEPVGAWADVLPAMPAIADLYAVYEKLLLCESVVVVARSPHLCSAAVSALVDAVRPVPYAGEARPYLTMQSDGRCVGLDGAAPPRPFVAGVTNPFLLQRIVAALHDAHRAPPHVLLLQAFDGPVPVKRTPSVHLRARSALDVPGGIGPHAPAKRFVKSDKGFLALAEGALRARPGQGQDQAAGDVGAVVRRHFAELTAQFLAPLNRYLAATVAPSATTPGGSVRYASFSAPDFLQSLAKHGTAVPLRGQSPLHRHRARDELYHAFCHSPNFYSWLDMKLSLEKEAAAGLLGARA